MTIQVLKFGGTSVGSSERVETVRKIVAGLQNDHPLVVVVSAMSKITDLLLRIADLAAEDLAAAESLVREVRSIHLDCFEKLNVAAARQVIDPLLHELTGILHAVHQDKTCSMQTRDLILSFGERLSARLIADYFSIQGCEAEFVDARQIVITDANHGVARVDVDETYRRAVQRFRERKIYVVTGYIAATPDGTTTTLGRGGSDYSAALLGAALDVERIEIWTDVDGVMSADPKIVKEAFVLPQVTYEEAMEMSYFGAKVIHPQTLVPAIQKFIPVLIKNSFAPEKPGTVISREHAASKFVVKGITSINGISLINMQGGGMVGVPGIAGRIFSALASREISVVLISQASSEFSICFAVQTLQAQRAIKVLQAEFNAEIHSGQIERVDCTNGLAIVAAVGEEMSGTSGLAGKLFSALGQNAINVIAIAQGSSERNLSLVVDCNDVAKAVNVIHSAFYLSRRVANLFVVGVGTVGSTLLKQLQGRQRELEEHHGLVLNLCGILNSKKMLIHEGGLSLKGWKEQLAEHGEKSDLDRLLNEIRRLKLANLIMVDATASDSVAARYLEFLEAGIHLVTPNKRASTRDQSFYDRLMKLVAGRRMQYFYETTVGAGLPVIGTIQDLKNSGDEIIKIEGILSGTLGYLFNTLSSTRRFSDIVKDAHQRGFTEPDPRDDLSGKDVQRKLLILAREVGLRMELDAVAVEPLLPKGGERGDLGEFWQRLPLLDAEIESRRARAEAKGAVLRYVASLKDGQARVGIEEIAKDASLARTGATDNIIKITTTRYADAPLTIQGPGAGPEVTAGGVFADVIRLAFHLN